MNRLKIPRRLRLAVIWGAAFTLVLALRYEMEYRELVKNLPQIVDAQGKTTSVEVAMTGLDSYLRAKQVRRYGLYSLGFGAVLCAGAAATGHREDRVHGG